MKDHKINEILNEAASAIPKNTEVYIVGGAVRNALYYEFFRKRIPQRDFDIVVIGQGKQFVQNLRKIGFIYGFLRRKNNVTLKKKIVNKPKHEFKDYVFLDIHFSHEPSIIESLKTNANFTINGLALSLNDIALQDWKKRIVSIPHALNDLKNKQLRVNAIVHPANFFACIRFMSLGFRPPEKKEIYSLLAELGTLEKWRYKRNVKKVFDYVGGEKKARLLVKKLGVEEDVFDLKTIKNLRNRYKTNLS